VFAGADPLVQVTDLGFQRGNTPFEVSWLHAGRPPRDTDIVGRQSGRAGVRHALWAEIVRVPVQRAEYPKVMMIETQDGVGVELAGQYHACWFMALIP
jgi:hypothetical protein